MPKAEVVDNYNNFYRLARSYFLSIAKPISSDREHLLALVVKHILTIASVLSKLHI